MKENIKESVTISLDHYNDLKKHKDAYNDNLIKKVRGEVYDVWYWKPRKEIFMEVDQMSNDLEKEFVRILEDWKEMFKKEEQGKIKKELNPSWFQRLFK